MTDNELKTLRELLETWVKRRRHLGEFNADSADIMILGQVLLAVVRKLQNADVEVRHPACQDLELD